MNRTLQRALAMAWVIALLLLSIALTACGGGEDLADEPDVPTPHLDCSANPKACS